jgi:hypothetical protein
MNWTRLTLLAALLAAPATAEARRSRMAYHATSQVWKSVKTKGKLSTKHAKPGRVGKKSVYFSLSKKGARKEKPGAKVMLEGRFSRSAWKNRIQTHRMNSKQLKKYSGLKDMRGTTKKGVMGPKLGNAVWKKAKKDGHMVQYRARGAKKRAWTNVAVPAKVYDHTKAVSKLKVLK